MVEPVIKIIKDQMTPVWEYKVPGNICYSIFLYESNIYVAWDNFKKSKCIVSCLDCTTGTEKWITAIDDHTSISKFYYFLGKRNNQLWLHNFERMEPGPDLPTIIHVIDLYSGEPLDTKVKYDVSQLDRSYFETYHPFLNGDCDMSLSFFRDYYRTKIKMRNEKKPSKTISEKIKLLLRFFPENFSGCMVQGTMADDTLCLFGRSEDREIIMRLNFRPDYIEVKKHNGFSADSQSKITSYGRLLYYITPNLILAYKI
jgi:hypothetical protein